MIRNPPRFPWCRCRTHNRDPTSCGGYTEPEKIETFQQFQVTHVVCPLRVQCIYLSHPTYRVAYKVADLGQFELDFCVSPSFPLAQPLPPNFHQPRQKWVDKSNKKSRTVKLTAVKVSLTSHVPILYCRCRTLCYGPRPFS